MSNKLLEFAKHVLKEQKEMGRQHGDVEYIKMAEEAIAEHEAKEAAKKRKKLYVNCCGRPECMATMLDSKAIYHDGKPYCKKCWKEMVEGLGMSY